MLNSVFFCRFLELFFSHSFVESLERPQIKHDQKAPSAEAVIMACWWNRFSKCSIVHTVFVFALWRASVFSVKRFLQRVLAVFIITTSLNQIKSNQITFIVTSPQHKCLGE